MSTAVREVQTTIVPANQAVAVPRARIMADALKEEAEQRQLLKEYVEQEMVDGVDYGIIPGTKKKTLLKPGAEKITSLYHCFPDFVLTQCVEDWEKPLFYYRFECKIKLVGTDSVVAAGVGSCNSMESRYRWRESARTCPHCGKAAIIKGKEEFGGGWLCFKKKEGCGAKWNDGDEVIESQKAGRVENDDIFAQANTILKMAKKRAHVDASIALARCSDLFTQDAEDDPALAGEGRPAKQQQQQNQTKPAQQSPDLRDRFHSLINQISKLEGYGADVEAGKILEHARSNGFKGNSIASMDDSWLKWCIEPLAKKLDRLQPKQQAKPAQQSRQEEPPQREPGDDDFDNEGDEGDLPPEHKPAVLPKDKQQKILDLLHAVNMAWHDQSVKDRCSQVFGRTIDPGAPLSELSIEEADKFIAALTKLKSDREAKLAQRRKTVADRRDEKASTAA